MSETLRYGVDEQSRLYVDMPPTTTTTLEIDYADVFDELRYLARAPELTLIASNDYEDMSRLTVDTEAIASQQPSQASFKLADRVVNFLGNLNRFAAIEDIQDPRIQIRIGKGLLPDGSYAVSATAAWPEGVADRDAGAQATRSMREAASVLNGNNEISPHYLFMRARRVESKGVVLRLEQQKGPYSDLYTSSTDFNPVEETFTIEGKIQTPRQVLIGLVALAGFATAKVPAELALE